MKYGCLKTIVLMLLGLVPRAGVHLETRDRQDGVMSFCAGFVPLEDRKLFSEEEFGRGGPVTEYDFYRSLDYVLQVYQPIFQAAGGRLVLRADWENDEMNAFASQEQGGVWSLNFFGGLARHPKMTLDGFLMVVCHEIGHHLGGAPRYPSGEGARDWASNEGQSDYFASSKCFRRLFGREDNSRFMNKNIYFVSPIIERTCRAAFPQNRNEEALCRRSALAGISVTSVLADLSARTRLPGYHVSPEWTDLNIVGRTKHRHPKAQCRLDTYLAGAMCPVDFRKDFDPQDPRVGACMNFHQPGYRQISRPQCWFSLADPLNALGM